MHPKTLEQIASFLSLVKLGFFALGALLFIFQAALILHVLPITSSIEGAKEWDPQGNYQVSN